MKKLILFMSAIALFLSAIGQNLVTNASFESDATGWAGYNRGVQSVDAFHGLKAGKINDNQDGSFVQNINFLPGHTYSASFYAKWPNGTGNAAGIALVVQDRSLSNKTFASTVMISDTTWTKADTVFTVPPNTTSTRIVMYKVKSPICYIDTVEIIDLGVIQPAARISAAAAITEGAEDGSVLSVEIMNDVFAANLVPANWTLTNLPEGVSIGSVNRIDDTHAEITLSGNATADYDKNVDASLTIGGSEFVTYNVVVQASFTVTFKAIVEPPPAIVLEYTGAINEDFEDGTVITVQMKDDTFKDPITPANWTPLNFPEGVTIGSVERVNDTAVKVTLSGNTTGDYDIDITNAGLTIAAEEFIIWLDPVNATGLTFVAAIEGGEEILWEENFDGYANGTNLIDTTGGKEPAFRWELLDSVIVTDGVANLHITKASKWSLDSVDHRFQYIYSPIEMGKTYIFYMDSKSNDGASTVVSVLVGEGGQFKTNATGSTEMVTRSVIVEPSLAGHDTAGCGIYNWGWNFTNRIVSIDNMKLVVLTDPRITMSDDGAIMEGAENGEVITITLQNDVFAATLNVANWTFTNLPDGVTAGSIKRVDDTHAEITLSGNSTTDYDVNVTDISVVGKRDEFVTSNKSLSISEGVKFTAVIEPPTITLSDDGNISKGAEDLEVITVSLTLDTFVASLNPANWTVTNLPTGVSLGEVFRVNDVTVELTLSGNSTQNYTSNITNVTVTVAAAELTEWTSNISANTGVTFIANGANAVKDVSIDGLYAYPNPVINELSISSDKMITKLDVYNLLGDKVVSINNQSSNNVLVNTEAWNQGIYLIQVKDADGNTGILRIVK